MARLRALHPLAPGNGPYAIRSPLALLIANGVYVFEMVTPVLLIWRRTRPYAAVAVLIVLAGIEVGARELLFGVLFVNLLLLFFARPVNRTLLPRRSPSWHPGGGARRPAAVLRLQLTLAAKQRPWSPRSPFWRCGRSRIARWWSATTSTRGASSVGPCTPKLPPTSISSPSRTASACPWSSDR
jgi:hypothetical protein